MGSHGIDINVIYTVNLAFCLQDHTLKFFPLVYNASFLSSSIHELAEAPSSSLKLSATATATIQQSGRPGGAMEKQLRFSSSKPEARSQEELAKSQQQPASQPATSQKLGASNQQEQATNRSQKPAGARTPGPGTNRQEPAASSQQPGESQEPAGARS